MKKLSLALVSALAMTLSVAPAADAKFRGFGGEGSARSPRSAAPTRHRSRATDRPRATVRRRPSTTRPLSSRSRVAVCSPTSRGPSPGWRSTTGSSITTTSSSSRFRAWLRFRPRLLPGSGELMRTERYMHKEAGVILSQQGVRPRSQPCEGGRRGSLQDHRHETLRGADSRVCLQGDGTLVGAS